MATSRGVAEEDITLTVFNGSGGDHVAEFAARYFWSPVGTVGEFYNNLFLNVNPSGNRFAYAPMYKWYGNTLMLDIGEYELFDENGNFTIMVGDEIYNHSEMNGEMILPTLSQVGAKIS